MSAVTASTPIDLKATISENRFRGMWLMMTGYRAAYFGALISLAIAAISKTLTYLLLAYLIDNVLGQGAIDDRLLLIGLGFVGLAAVEGTFTFFSGRLSALTSEGIAQRLRDYLFDHIQR